MSNNDDIIISSKKYSKHLIEYFLLKFQNIYILTLLLTVTIYFFIYNSGTKIPGDYLVVFVVLGIIGLVISLYVGIYHWDKNDQRKKEEEEKLTSNPYQKSDLTETWLKRSQFIIVSVFLLALSIINIVYMNSETFPSSVSFGLAIPSLLLFMYTIFVFVWSFYYVSERSYNVGIKQEVLKPKSVSDLY